MFEFAKICGAYENLSAVEKGLILTEKSVKILSKLHYLEVPGVDPVSALAGFIVGSVVADGKVNEQEYILIYPALVRVFGDDFDFTTVKDSFRKDKEGRRMLTEYTEEMVKVFGALDDELKNDIITLCLCVVAVDGKVSLKEKNYIKRLCRA